MNSLSTKLAFSALVVAALATPAFARSHHARRHLEDYAGAAAVQQFQPQQYPNGGGARTGTAESVESGAIFNLGY